VRWGKRGVSPAALITLAAALVLLTAVASYIAYANTLKIHESLRKNLRVEEEMRREPKVSLLAGLPPGVSPQAYIAIHEMSGYEEVLRDLVFDDNRSNIVHRELNINMREGDCVILTPRYLQQLGLPTLYKQYNGTTLIIHSSRATAKAVPRELKPDEVYPCTKLPSSQAPQRPILLHVMLDGNICNRQECRDLLNPPARPTAYVVDTYSVFTVTAAATATIGGTSYRFVGWDVYLHPMQVNQPTRYTGNPLNLFVDDAYDVVAVYVSG
jgi:hypothetical protein